MPVVHCLPVQVYSMNSPSGKVTVHRAAQLRLGGIPLLSWLEWDCWRSVVDDRKCAHPEVVSKPRHKPELHKAKRACKVQQSREDNSNKSIHSRQADLDLQAQEGWLNKRNLTVSR